MIDHLVERQAADRRSGGEGAKQPRRETGRQHDELPEIVGAADQPAERLPDARHALELDPALLRDELAPLYGRPPDAKLPG